MFRRIALVVFLIFTILAVVVALKNDRLVTTTSDEAYEHYLAGIEWQENLYFRQAMEEFEEAIKLDSNFAMAQARLANVYAGRGFVKKSEEMKAAALAQRERLTYREQLILDIYKAGWDLDREKAYELSKEFLKQFPEDRDAQFNLAIQEYNHENYEVALELFQNIINKEPGFAPAYNLLGYLNYFLGRYDDALEMLDKYIELSRDQANPHDSRGEILHATGRYEEAITEFRQAFNINPEFDFAAIHMAQSYQALGQNDQTDYCFEILLGQSPNDLQKRNYIVNWASLMVAREDYESASKLLVDLIGTTPEEQMDDLGGACRVMGSMYYRQKNLDSLVSTWTVGRQMLAKSLEKHPQFAEERSVQQWQRFMDGTEAELQGDHKRAEGLFSELVESSMTPDEKVAYRIYYAEILARDGDLDLAISELQKNLTINANHPRTLIHLANVYEEMGDNDQALHYRERAAEVWKNADADFIPMNNLRAKLGSSVASAVRTVPTPAAPSTIN